MELEMPNDGTDTLTPPSDPACGVGMNLTAYGVSGEFIAWDRAGKLEELVSLCVEAQAILRQLYEVERKLRDCNASWVLIKMKEACKRQGKDFVAVLEIRVQKLEDQKRIAKHRLNEIQLRIGNAAPDLLRHTQELATDFPSIVRTLPHRVSDAVASRNAVIDKYVGDHTLEICKKLDLYFASRGLAPELPAKWTTKYKVKTFTEAYRNPGCRPLVQTMISKRRLTVKRRIASR